MWTFCRLLLLLVGILLVNFQLAIRQGEFAEPISVTLTGFSALDVAFTRLIASSARSDQPGVIPMTRPGTWDCPPRCIAALALLFAEVPETKTGTVQVKIGAKEFTLTLADFDVDGLTYSFRENVMGQTPPGFAWCRNWPGLPAFATYYCQRTAPGLAAILLIALVAAVGMGSRCRGLFQAIFEITPAPAVAVPSWDRLWNLSGWVFLGGAFVCLELSESYYFTQDDALVGELPAILLASRSLWEGTFPDWNPYVFMGAPLAPMGFWGVTYPPQLLAYGIARHILMDEFATVEVLAALHLLIGFAAMRYLGRRLGMGALAANVAALSFVLAGCILIMGRSWHYFLANAVWLPLLGIAIERFRTGPVTWKWVAGVGLVFGLAYHAGFPQVAAILAMFFAIGLATVTYADRISPRRVAAVLPALMLGAGLALPLLLHQLQMTGGLERFAPEENGVYDDLPAALLPYPLVEAGLPTHWGSLYVEKMGHFYFFGGLFALLFAVQAYLFWVYLPERRVWARCWWVPCGIFALLMVLGEPAYLWKGVSALPMSKLFLRYTFRFYPCLAFCAILAGGLVLERSLAMLRQRRAWELILGPALLVILAYHVTMCQPSFYSYGFRPYPDLPESFEAIFHPHANKQLIDGRNSRRTASWAQFRSVSPDHYLSLPLNLPHFYQVPSIFGYDPVVEGQPRMAEVLAQLQKDPVTASKAYGVGWHLFSYPADPVLSPNKYMWGLEKLVTPDLAYYRLLKADLKSLAEYHGTTLKELPGADPLAFVNGRPENALPIKVNCRGVDIDVGGLAAGAAVTVNFLWYPQMTLTMNGQSLPVDKDNWLRITTTLPEAGSILHLRFEPPWYKTCAVGAVICLGALVLGWWVLRSPNRVSPLWQQSKS